MAVRNGAICYLDEIVEVRKDTTVAIHPLTDNRREQLPVEKLGKLFSAAPGFMLAVSYNPGYQSILKDLKPSTRQRFVSFSFDYPPPDLEQEIVIKESGIDRAMAQMVKLATMTRSLKDSGLAEGASTRLIIQTVKLIRCGIDTVTACRAGMLESLTDDPELLAAMDEMVFALFKASWLVHYTTPCAEKKVSISGDSCGLEIYCDV